MNCLVRASLNSINDTLRNYPTLSCEQIWNLMQSREELLTTIQREQDSTLRTWLLQHPAAKARADWYFNHFKEKGNI